MAVALALWLSLGCASTSIHTRTWVEARTAHFTIWSCEDEDDTLELARDLELFRSVVEFVSGQRLPTSPVPIYVYAFNTPVTYRPFAVRGAAGHFEQSMRQNTIVIGGRTSTRVDTTQLIQHEYVHYLLENHGDFVYPSWYHEGFAEFLGTVRVKGDQVEIGAVPNGRVPQLIAWTPLEEVLGRRPGDRISVMALYGQSWALVHYLSFERVSGTRANQQLTRYFRSLERGMSVQEAVERSFGTSIDELDDELRSYVRRGRYKSALVEIEEFDLGSAPGLRPLSPAEVAVALGRLSLERERYEQAIAYFQKASVLDPAAAHARAGLGDTYVAQEMWEEAARAYDLAVETAPDDALIALGQGNLLYERARRAGAADERARLAREARSHYVRSWKLDDSIPETYARYGMTFLLDGEDTARGLKTLKHAHDLLPSSMEIRIRLAEMQLRLGDRKEARRLALSAANSVHDEEGRARIEALLAETAFSGS